MILPFKDDFTVSHFLFQELIELNKGQVFGQVSQEHSLRRACDNAAASGLARFGWVCGLEALLEATLLEKQVETINRVCEVKHG